MINTYTGAPCGEVVFCCKKIIKGSDSEKLLRVHIELNVYLFRETNPIPKAGAV